jgi:hypothetical protein
MFISEHPIKAMAIATAGVLCIYRHGPQVRLFHARSEHRSHQIHPCMDAQVFDFIKGILPRAVTINGLSDLFQLFVIVSILLPVLLRAFKGLASWWEDWVHMPGNITTLKTDVDNLKSRTSWLSFLDKCVLRYI